MKKQNKIEKVIRDGKVAVLVSGGYGAGWYTWSDDCLQCLFSPTIVKMIEEGKRAQITDEFCAKLFKTKYFYSGGAGSLRIEWLDEGTKFKIDEYDGSESLVIIDQIEYITA